MNFDDLSSNSDEDDSDEELFIKRRRVITFLNYSMSVLYDISQIPRMIRKPNQHRKRDQATLQREFSAVGHT